MNKINVHYRKKLYLKKKPNIIFSTKKIASKRMQMPVKLELKHIKFSKSRILYKRA